MIDYRILLLMLKVRQKKRRLGELITIASGVGIAVLGLIVNVPPVSYGGLCIMGLGVFSVFWR
jgi:hypothetical protein